MENVFCRPRKAVNVGNVSVNLGAELGAVAGEQVIQEPAIFFFGNAPKFTDGIKSGLGKSLLDPFREKVAGHP